MDWMAKKVLVTGGASFISSHLIDLLVEKGARSIRVVDDLTSGKLANIQHHIDSGVVEFRREDLLAPGVAQRAVAGMDVVFHLAAIHGGRGFVDLHQAACAQNLAMDGLLVKAAHEAGVAQLRALLPDVDVVSYDLPYWHGRGEILHLMSLVSPLDADLALVYLPLLPVPRLADDLRSR